MSEKMHSRYRFERLDSELFPLAKQFYKRARYHSHVGRKDEIYVIRDKLSDQQIVAAVRLVCLDQHLMLRSMVVLPNQQRSGIGRLFLRELKPMIAQRECWCFPFEWLTGFYGLVDFKLIEPTMCPIIIKQKYQQYCAQGRKLVVMKSAPD
jgi:hypothetical protein